MMRSLAQHRGWLSVGVYGIGLHLCVCVCVCGYTPNVNVLLPMFYPFSMVVGKTGGGQNWWWYRGQKVGDGKNFLCDIF